MPEQRAELRISLPRAPVLRVLTYYVVGALLLLATVRVAVPALALPSWMGTLIVLAVILAAPIVAATAWLASRRG